MTREKIKNELAKLAADREKIVENSTEKKLERVTVRERDLQ